MLLVLSLSGMLLGCAKSPPPAGKAVAIENLCNEADGARVRMTGHLGYRRSLLSFCSSYGGKKTCDLALYASATPADFDVMRPRTKPEPVHARLSIPVGDAPGQMAELPEKFSRSDVVLYLQDKGKASDGSRVTIDGKLSVIPQSLNTPGGAAPKSCFVNVDWASAG
jgi:hypothetical protein